MWKRMKIQIQKVKMRKRKQIQIKKEKKILQIMMKNMSLKKTEIPLDTSYPYAQTHFFYLTVIGRNITFYVSIK